MIKTERGTVEIKGEISEILTDFEMIGRAMKEVLIREMGEEKSNRRMGKSNRKLRKERGRKNKGNNGENSRRN